MLANEQLPSRITRAPRCAHVDAKTSQRGRSLQRSLPLCKIACLYAWAKFRGRLSGTQQPWHNEAQTHRLSRLWLIAGHALAHRSVVANVTRVALNQLQDLDASLPFQTVRRLLEKQLGASLEAQFQHFDEKPYFSSGIAQYHRAYFTRAQTWVTVKLQKPAAHDLMVQDLALFRRITSILHRLSIRPHMNWPALYQQLEVHMNGLLDFRFEASALQRLKQQRQSHLYIPDIFPEYSSQQILLVEYIDAPSMADYIHLQAHHPAELATWLQENNLQPAVLAKRLFHTVFRQTLASNLFVEQMCPRSIALLRNNRFALLDCASVYSLDQEIMHQYHLLLQALAKHRYDSAAEYFLLLAPQLPIMDVANGKAELVKLWRTWETKTHISKIPYAEKSIFGLLQTAYALPAQSQLVVQWPQTKLLAAWQHLDHSLQHLVPNMNYRQYLCRYFRRAAQHNTKLSPKDAMNNIPRNLYAAYRLPQQLTEYTFYRRFITRRQVLTYQGTVTMSNTWLNAVLSMASAALLLLLCGLLCAVSYQHWHYPVEVIIGPQLSAWVQAIPAISLGGWAILFGCVLYAFAVALKIKRCVRVRNIVSP